MIPNTPKRKDVEASISNTKTSAEIEYLIREYHHSLRPSNKQNFISKVVDTIKDLTTQYSFMVYMTEVLKQDRLLERLFSNLYIKDLTSEHAKEQFQKFQQWICDQSPIQQTAFNHWLSSSNRDHAVGDKTALETYRESTDATKQRAFINWMNSKLKAVFEQSLLEAKSTSSLAAEQLKELNTWYSEEYPRIINALKDGLKHKKGSAHNSCENFFKYANISIDTINTHHVTLKKSTIDIKNLYNQWLDEQCYEKQIKHFEVDPTDAVFDIYSELSSYNETETRSPLARSEYKSDDSSHDLENQQPTSYEARLKTVLTRIEILDKKEKTIGFIYFQESSNEQESIQALNKQLVKFGMQVDPRKMVTPNLSFIEKVRIISMNEKKEEYLFGHKKGCLYNLLTPEQEEFLIGSIDSGRLKEYIGNDKRYFSDYNKAAFLAWYGYIGEVGYWGFAWFSVEKALEMLYTLMNVTPDINSIPNMLLKSILLLCVIAANVTYVPSQEAEKLIKKMMLHVGETFWDILLLNNIKKNPLMSFLFLIFSLTGAMPDMDLIGEYVDLKKPLELFAYILTSVTMLTSGPSYYFAYNFDDVINGTKPGLDAFKKALKGLFSENLREKAKARDAFSHMILSLLQRDMVIAYGPISFLSKILGPNSAVPYTAGALSVPATTITVPGTRFGTISHQYFPKVSEETIELARATFKNNKESSVLQQFKTSLALKQDPSTILVLSAAYIVPALATLALGDSVSPEFKRAIQIVGALAIAQKGFDYFSLSSEEKAINHLALKLAGKLKDVSFICNAVALGDQLTRIMAIPVILMTISAATFNPQEPLGQLLMLTALSLTAFLSYSAFKYQAMKVEEAFQVIGGDMADTDRWQSFHQNCLIPAKRQFERGLANLTSSMGTFSRSSENKRVPQTPGGSEMVVTTSLLMQSLLTSDDHNTVQRKL